MIGGLTYKIGIFHVNGDMSKTVLDCVNGKLLGDSIKDTVLRFKYYYSIRLILKLSANCKAYRAYRAWRTEDDYSNSNAVLALELCFTRIEE